MFSKLQRDVLEMLSDGVDWTALSADELEALRYLEGLGLAGAREDLRTGLWMLTERGKAVLQELHSAEKLSQEEAEERAQEKAEQKKEKRGERWFRILELFLAALIGAVFTNLDRIIVFLVEWIPRIWSAIWK